jgi:hypothetical protein
MKLALIALALMMVAPPRATELQYTRTVSSHAATATPAAAPANPLLAMIGPMVVNMLAPAEGVTSTVTVGARGTRIEYAQAYLMVPAGGVVLTRPDGSLVVLNPAARTYWKTPAPGGPAADAASAATIDVQRTGERSVVSGLRVERAAVTIRAPLPIPKDLGIPGLPSELVLTGDAWLSDEYKQFDRAGSSLLGGLSALGLAMPSLDGFLVRSVLRGELLGGQEIESNVTAVHEVTAPATLFDVPVGFTEVPPPSPGGLLPPVPR